MGKPLISYALRALSIFYPPQKPLLFSGPGSTGKLADFILASGQTRPLLVTDSFLIKQGMLADVLGHLKQNGCTVTIFDTVTPNPTFSVVEAGLKQSLDHHCDSVLAIGGGSVIDAAKVIAGASTNRRRLRRLVGILKLKKAPLPFYVVPTTSGSGSEVTTTAVISDDTTHKKKFFVDARLIPLAAALDPDLLKSLPASTTAAVGMDALTHAVEAYSSRNNFDDTDRDASTAIRLLFEYLSAAYEDGNNLKAREMVALASFLAGYAFTKSSLGYVHAISHQISAHYNTAHGLTNAVLLPHVLRFNKPSCITRFAALEKRLEKRPEKNTSLQSQGVSDAILAGRFIDRVDELARRVGIPLHLLDLNRDDFGAIAKAARAEARSTYAVPRRMRDRDIKAILQSVAPTNQKVSWS